MTNICLVPQKFINRIFYYNFNFMLLTLILSKKTLFVNKCLITVSIIIVLAERKR